MNNISYDDRRIVYQEAILTYGRKPQFLMVIEEMSELTKAICKLFREPRNLEPSPAVIDAIADECADVTIMLEQLRLILDLNDAVCEHMDAKVLRLAERLGIAREDMKVGGKNAE